MLRRHADDPGETKIYRSSAPPDTPREALVGLAGTHWPVGSAILEATSEPGLDHHEVRGWRRWHRPRRSRSSPWPSC